jgi:hypothetical protein
MRRSGFLLAVGLALVLLAATSAQAITITGHIGFSGAVTYDTRGTSGDAVIDFAPTSGGDGDLIVISSVTEYFAGIPDFPDNCSIAGGDCAGATILDMRNFSGGVDPATYIPAGPSTTNNFISGFVGSTLPAFYSGLHFDLTELVVQSGTTCGLTLAEGDSCVEGPFVLTQTDQGLKIQFDVLGYFRNGSDEGYYNGSFSAVFNNMEYATYLNRVTGTGEDLRCGTDNLTANCTFSANFDPIANNAVPEPATLLTFGLGASLLAARRRMKAKGAKV